MPAWLANNLGNMVKKYVVVYIPTSVSISMFRQFPEDLVLPLGIECSPSRATCENVR